MAKTVIKEQRLGDLLVNAGVISEAQLQDALEDQRKTNDRLGRVLTRLGFVTEEVMVAFLASHLNIPYVNLSELDEVDPDMRRLVPEFLVRRQFVFPISKDGNTLTVAMADPLNVLAIDDISLITGCQVKVVVATETEIRKAIERYYGRLDILGDIIRNIEEKEVELVKEDENEEEIDIGKLISEGGEAPVVNLVNHILAEAIKAGASDIHIEPYEKSLRTRYRIDGILYEVVSPPKHVQAAVVSRIKIMSRLDIAERRLPQDGRCKVRLEGKEVDLRVSIVPTNFGEKVVMRILDPATLCLDMTALGFEPDVLSIYQKNIQVPYGIILDTGPTGCGKSTTLYSTLSSLNSPDKNIMTIEDPIEYVLPGINQVHVKPDIGLDFASGLRAFLRQDPDIILVGEIRDRETAEVAINAALTGHLVLSTLHTNDAPSAVTRLINMGIEPFLIASTVVMCIAQRLVRVICPKCKEPYEVSSKTLENVGIQVEKGRERVTLYRGTGCKNCTNIGYRGRTAIFEVMPIDDTIRDLVLNRKPSHIVKKAAKEAGMVTLRDAAIRKVLNGITTVEELLRVTFEEAAE
ncbi:MAG: type IV-A pilus assembly ATPase PilB [bacterium]|nr:type IV-A pilus assembly ATPase PilB [bacterium]